jgi:hypothetical protein
MAPDRLRRALRRCARLGPALLVAAVALACRPTVELATPAPGPAEAARHRAALATLSVENRTAQRLTIAFRPAGQPGAATITIGAAAPGQLVELAPVPAGEPIVLIARAEDGRTHELPARTFAIDETWTWVVRQDTRFRSRGA